MAWTEETGGGFSLVEHPIPPKTLVAPLHLHEREDEYSFVVEGRMGAKLGDDVVYAEVGDLAFKPRNQWHTFWNPDDTPCRILEIIAPGGFEHFFDEMATSDGRRVRPGEAGGARCRLRAPLQPRVRPELCAEHGLTHPMLEMMEASGAGRQSQRESRPASEEPSDIGAETRSSPSSRLTGCAGGRWRA